MSHAPQFDIHSLTGNVALRPQIDQSIVSVNRAYRRTSAYRRIGLKLHFPVSHILVLNFILRLQSLAHYLLEDSTRHSSAANIPISRFIFYRSSLAILICRVESAHPGASWTN